VTETDFSQLPLLIVLTNLAGLLPLPFLFLLPKQARTRDARREGGREGGREVEREGEGPAAALPFLFLLPKHARTRDARIRTYKERETGGGGGEREKGGGREEERDREKRGR
jgi:hypothetical protein